jgi:hypothetical protein
VKVISPNQRFFNFDFTDLLTFRLAGWALLSFLKKKVSKEFKTVMKMLKFEFSAQSWPEATFCFCLLKLRNLPSFGRASNSKIFGRAIYSNFLTHFHQGHH